MAVIEDCTFLYFKPSGKWKYAGRGMFPPYPGSGYQHIDRAAIIEANGGMPGIITKAEDMIVVVLPDDDCSHPFAFPRMLLPDNDD